MYSHLHRIYREFSILSSTVDGCEIHKTLPAQAQDLCPDVVTYGASDEVAVCWGVRLGIHGLLRIRIMDNYLLVLIQLWIICMDDIYG